VETRRSWRSAILRAFWGALGAFFIGVGVIGIFVPGLPTTPFVLLAAACFSRSSDRLNQWLRRHPAFGKLIYDWENGRRIDRKAKITALVVMAAGLVVSSFLLSSRPVLLGVTMVTVSCVAVYVWLRPE
jgi:uncharacterized protein